MYTDRQTQSRFFSFSKTDLCLFPLFHAVSLICNDNLKKWDLQWLTRSINQGNFDKTVEEFLKKVNKKKCHVHHYDLQSNGITVKQLVATILKS